MTEINNLFEIGFSGTYPELPKNSWHDSPGIHQTFRSDSSGWRTKIAIRLLHHIVQSEIANQLNPKIVPRLLRNVIIHFEHEVRPNYIRLAPPSRPLQLAF